MDKPHILYAMPHSLYSGRARSYLIKNRIPFEERSTGHESFKAEVLPKSKLPTIPTLVTPEGEVIRDGAAIIEHFEAANRQPCQPPGARQQVISALFDVIGTDGLLRPAMHYRWNFPDDNLAFVRYHFLHSQRDVPEREEKTEAMMNRMRHAAMIFGVTERSQPVVEALYLEYLDALTLLGFQWQLFNGGINYSTAKSSFSQQQNFLAQSRSQSDFVVKEVRSNYAAMFGSQKAIRVTNSAYRSAQVANEAATMRYRAGLENVTTIVQTVQLLANASIERTRSLVEYNTAISNLYLYAAVWPDSTYPIVEQLLNPTSSSSKPNQAPSPEQ